MRGWNSQFSHLNWIAFDKDLFDKDNDNTPWWDIVLETFVPIIPMSFKNQVLQISYFAKESSVEKSIFHVNLSIIYKIEWWLSFLGGSVYIYK